MATAVAGRRSAAAALPEWIQPQLTQLVATRRRRRRLAARNQIRRLPQHARLDRGAVKFLTRTGLDLTHKCPAIAAARRILSQRGGMPILAASCAARAEKPAKPLAGTVNGND